MEIDYEKMEDGKIKLPVNRTLYLNQLLKGIKGTEVIKNGQYKEIVHGLNQEQLEEEVKVPKNLDSVLRYYQKTGFRWLKTLDKYHFGGILADDMGLRKNNTDVVCDRGLCTK